MKFVLLPSLLFFCHNVTHAQQFLYPDGQHATQQNSEQNNLLTLERETAARESAVVAGNSNRQKEAEYQQQQQTGHQQPQASYSFFYADAEGQTAEVNNSALKKHNFQIYFVPFNGIDGQHAADAAAASLQQGVRKFDATNQVAARQFYVPQQQQQIQYQQQLYHPQQHSEQQQDHQQQQQQNLQKTAPQAFPTITLTIPRNSQNYMTFYHQHPAIQQQQMYPHALPLPPQLQHPGGTMPQFTSYRISQPQHLTEQFQAPFRASPFMGYNIEQSAAMDPTLYAHAQMQGNFYPTTGQHYHRYVKPIHESPREGQSVAVGDQAAAGTMKNAEKFLYLSPQNMYALFRTRRS